MATFAWAVPGGVRTMAVLAVVLVAAWILSLGELRRMEHRPRALVLFALRTVGLVAAFLVGAQPTWSGEHVERRPGRLLVLMDESRSMGVAEGRGARMDAVHAFVAAHPELGAENVAAVAVASGLRALSRGDAEELAPLGTESRLLDSIVTAAEGAEVGAVLLVSDGADRSKDATLERIAATGMRVHTVGVGTDDGFSDDAIVDVRADATGFVHQETRVRVELRSSKPRTTLTVFLRRDGEILEQVSVALDDTGKGYAELSFTPNRPGRAAYEVYLPSRGDDDVPENNVAAFLVNVRRDKLRVLHVAGRPSWDERFLRAFLKKDPSIDLVSFFILRTSTDLTMAAPGEMALIPFPTDELFSEHLESFDLVIFQNFNFGPYDMAPYLPRIRDYVRRGGAFAMVGGELSFAGGGYAETPLAEVLPVVMPPSSSSPARQFVFDRFRPVLDAAFARHPLVELRPDALGNQQAWARLSPVEGANVVDGVRPTGDVLLRHPTYPVAGGTLPLLVVAQVDRGRVLALTTDSSWRWGLTTGGATGDASAYGTFWDHALRWLAMDPLLDPTRLRVDAERLAPGESFDVQGVARDRHYIPLTEALAWTVERADTHAAVSAGTVRADARGRLTWRATAPVETGVYRITLKDPGGIALTEELFVVGAGASELANPWPNAALLRAVAERTGGKHFASLGDVPRLTDIDATRERVVGRKTMAPLATPWAFAILVALLAADWALRRRWGLR